MNRQRIVAMSAGTREFWVVNPEKRTAQVTNLSGIQIFAAGSVVPVQIFEAASIPAEQIFEV